MRWANNPKIQITQQSPEVQERSLCVYAEAAGCLDEASFCTAEAERAA